MRFLCNELTPVCVNSTTRFCVLDLGHTGKHEAWYPNSDYINNPPGAWCVFRWNSDRDIQLHLKMEGI